MGSCELVVGSCELTVGSYELTVGSCELVVGPCELTVGSCELVVGSCELTVGLCEFMVGLCELTVGSCELKVGSCELMVGSCELRWDHVSLWWDRVSSWWDHVSSWWDCVTTCDFIEQTLRPFLGPITITELPLQLAHYRWVQMVSVVESLEEHAQTLEYQMCAQSPVQERREVYEPFSLTPGYTVSAYLVVNPGGNDSRLWVGEFCSGLLLLL